MRELYAIEQVHKHLKLGDTLYEEARDRLEEAEDRFGKALCGVQPGLLSDRDELDSREFLAPVTINNGLKLGKGEQSAEAQIEALLASSRANYKLAIDLQDDFSQYFAMAEADLWPSGKGNRRTPWRDAISRAKSNSAWPWMRAAAAWIP